MGLLIMNKTYRLIWNRRLGAWVAAAETTPASGKKSSGRARAGVAAAGFAAALGASLPLAAADLALGALPTGGTVAAGQADIAASGTRMDITQSSQKAIINWQGFDIGSQAQVNFAQPNAAAVALNRVSGPNISRIEGQITASGQVFLVNPSGVIFGNGARVNAGAFVASTLNIRDDDFLAGNYTFTGTGGAIENRGTISAAPGGYVAFIAPKITNAGTVSAPQGTVTIGAGERVTLNFAGDRLVGLSVAAETLDTLIENRQAIRAEGGTILLTAAGAEAVTRGVINNSGVLEAGSLTADGGRIVLTAGNDVNLASTSTVAVDGQKGGEITVKAKSGTLLADGSLSARGTTGTGGNVQLLGHQVGLINSPQVDASGATGGGTVLVGGDYQGGNAAVQNAWRTYVSPAATIRADALQQGDGGKVIIWADDVTRFYGKISATGGTLAGNGGFVEVSGKGYLDFNGVVDTGAPNGSVGTLLLDPTNIEVVTGGTATLAQVDQFADPDLTASCAAFGGAACSRIAPATINVATANVILQATNNILFTNAVSMTNPGWSLTATAQTGNITVNAPIITANRATSGTTGSVTLNAGGNVMLNADITTGNATVADAGGNQTAYSGNIAITTGTGISGAGRLITGNTTLTGAAAGTEQIRSGNITLNVTGAGTIGLSGANALTIGSATGNGAGSTATTGNITFTSADRINNGTAGGALDVSFGTAAGGATNTVGSLTATTDGGAGASGEIAIGSGEALRLGAINAAGGAVTLDVGAATTAAGVISGTGTSLTKLGAGTLTLSGANAYTGATNINAGTLALGAANRIANTSAVTVAAGATFNLANFAETIGSLAGAGNVTLGSATLTAGGNNTTTSFSGVVSGTGGLTKTGTGAMTLSGANTYTGTTTISSGLLALFGGAAIADTSAVNLSAAGANLTLNASETIGSLAGVASTSVSLNGNTLTAGGNNGTTTYAGVIGGTGGLTKAGTGTLTLSGNNTYTGATTINAGTLTLGASNRIADPSTVNVAAGASFNLAGFSETIDILTGGGTVTKTGAGTTTLMVGANNGSGTFSGVIQNPTGTLALTKIGTGTQTLSGANTYSGLTTISGGAIFAASNGALGNATGATSVASGATLALNGGVTIADALTLNGTGVGGAGALRNLGGSNTASGAVTLASATRINSDAGLLTLSGAIGGSAQALTVGGSGNTTISGVIGTTTGSLTKDGVGMLTLSGANTYTGATTISSGTLALSGGVAISDASAVNLGAAGANLTLNASETIGSLAGVASTSVTLNANTLTAGGNNGTTIYAGGIGGTGNLIKNGAGSMTLSGNSTYAGLTTVNAGTLAVTANNALGSNAAGTTVNAGATLDLQNVAYSTAELVTLNGGTLAVSTGNSSLAGPVNLTAASFVNVGSPSQLTLSGAVTAPVNLDVNGGGSLTAVNAANNFSTVSITSGNNISLRDANAINLGASTVSGALTVTSIGNISQSGSLNVAGLTTLAAGGGNITLNNGSNNFGTVAASGVNVALADSNAIDLGTTNAAANLTVSANGAITQSGVLVVAGASSFLANANPITLNNASNDFGGEVSLTNSGSTNNVQIRDVNHLTLGTSSIGGTLTAIAGGTLTLSQFGTGVSAGGSGDAITLVGSRFVNLFGAGALSAPAGRWLVWSSNPSPFSGAMPDNRGGLAYDFKQYNATYGVTPVQGTGNGFLYTVAPTIAPGLTGTVSKVYDTTTTAPLTAANFTPTTGVDGDVITMTGTGAYDNPNVAGSPTKLVTASGISATITSSVAEGSKPVYGYTLTSTTASANIGEITPAPLTITGNTTSSQYTANAQTNGYTVSGLLTGNGDSVTGVSTLASGTNVGTYADNLTSATGTGLANYTIGYVNGSLTITPAPLTITANHASRPVNAPNPQFTASYAGFVGGETPAVLNGALSFSTPATQASPVGIYPITPYGQSSGNYAITYVDGDLTVSGAPVIPPTLPREAVNQQAIAAQYTDPTTSTETLVGPYYVFDDDREGKEGMPPASTVRIVGSGIRLPN